MMASWFPPTWDLSYLKGQALLYFAIDEFDEVAVESPVWIIELQEGCKTSMDIINYMQEFGWSGKCICREAKYLSSQCAYCKEQMSHLYEEIFSLDGLCGEI